MIFLRDLTLRRGVKVLFEHVTVSFLRGQKIGVTGANGAGKSSLFSLIKEDLHADAGDIEVQPRIVFGEVAQDLPHGDRPAIEYVLDGDAELRVIEAQLRFDHTQFGITVEHIFDCGSVTVWQVLRNFAEHDSRLHLDVARVRVEISLD